MFTDRETLVMELLVMYSSHPCCANTMVFNALMEEAEFKGWQLPSGYVEEGTRMSEEIHYGND